MKHLKAAEICIILSEVGEARRSLLKYGDWTCHINTVAVADQYRRSLVLSMGSAGKLWKP